MRHSRAQPHHTEPLGRSAAGPASCQQDLLPPCLSVSGVAKCCDGDLFANVRVVDAFQENENSMPVF